MVGTPAQTGLFREAARALPNPLVTVRTIGGPMRRWHTFAEERVSLPPVRTPAELAASTHQRVNVLMLRDHDAEGLHEGKGGDGDRGREPTARADEPAIRR